MATSSWQWRKRQGSRCPTSLCMGPFGGDPITRFQALPTHNSFLTGEGSQAPRELGLIPSQLRIETPSCRVGLCSLYSFLFLSCSFSPLTPFSLPPSFSFLPLSLPVPPFPSLSFLLHFFHSFFSSNFIVSHHLFSLPPSFLHPSLPPFLFSLRGLSLYRIVYTVLIL